MGADLNAGAFQDPDKPSLYEEERAVRKLQEAEAEARIADKVHAHEEVWQRVEDIIAEAERC